MSSGSSAATRPPRWYDEQTAPLLHDLVLARRPTLAAGRLVAVDGPAGSGKTTLARQLAAELPGGPVGNRGRIVTVHLDDLYEGWTGLNDTLESRVVDQLLTPLAQGGAATWQRYDWVDQEFDEWVTISPGVDVLILEGCGAGARAYAAYTSLLVWVEAPREVRIRRGVERDGIAVLPRWLAWMKLENSHFEENQTKARAAIRITTG
ncbi:MAG: AAA family ATPase [Nocardioidaceae bacterium]